MESNIFHINVPKNNIVATLEDLLEQAKSGNIETLAIAGIDSKGNSWSGYIADDYIFTLVGSLELLKQRIINEQVED